VTLSPGRRQGGRRPRRRKPTGWIARPPAGPGPSRTAAGSQLRIQEADIKAVVDPEEWALLQVEYERQYLSRCQKGRARAPQPAAGVPARL